MLCWFHRPGFQVGEGSSRSLFTLKSPREEIVMSRPFLSPVSLSEGSVVAYYVSEFHVPAGQEAAVDKAMAEMDRLVDKEQRSVLRAGNSLLFDDVVSSGTVRAADMCEFSVSASKLRSFFFPSSRHPIHILLVQP